LKPLVRAHGPLIGSHDPVVEADVRVVGAVDAHDRCTPGRQSHARTHLSLPDYVTK